MRVTVQGSNSMSSVWIDSGDAFLALQTYVKNISTSGQRQYAY